MATTEAIALLRSIDASLKQLTRAAGGSAPTTTAADDADLDGTYGNPIVKFCPRDWHGESFKGQNYSEAPADFLDLLAGALDYFARKDDESGKVTAAGKPTAPYVRRDAARARGWAKRKRAGWVNTATGEIADPEDGKGNGPAFEDSEWPADDDSIPF
jgi:hypothetical protein